MMGFCRRFSLPSQPQNVVKYDPVMKGRHAGDGAV
jgi:hypothetical protein